MSVTNPRRRERDSSPEPTENIPSPTRKRSSSPFNENENDRNDDSGGKRCKCYSCSGEPYDVNRNWSIRFFGRSKEFHDRLIRLLDESLEDTYSEKVNFSPTLSREDPYGDYASLHTDPWDGYTFLPTDPTEIVNASPGEIEESSATTTDPSDDLTYSSDESSLEEANDIVVEVQRDQVAAGDDGPTRGRGDDSHLIPNIVSSTPRND